MHPQPEPAVQRVAPELPVRGEIVRRHAGHALRVQIPIHLEIQGVLPHVAAARRYVDRDIAEQGDLFIRRVRPERGPLPVEQVLHEGVVKHPVLEGLKLPGGLRVVVGGIAPESHRPGVEGAVGLHQRLVLRVGPYPGLAVRKALDLRLQGGDGRVERLLQAGGLGLFHRVKIHFGRRLGLEGHAGGEDPLLPERLEVDQQGIAREGRRALIGGCAVPGRAHRQHLPYADTGVMKKIDHLTRGRAKGADPLRPGQRREMHQHPALPHTQLLSRSLRPGR